MVGVVRQLQHLVLKPHSRNKRFLFAAIQDEECVGALELTISVQQPTEPVQVELGVAPGQQSRGIGRELASYAVGFLRERGCAMLQAEAAVPDAQRVQSWTGMCPPEFGVAWTQLRQQMEEDVPVGALTRGDTVVDARLHRIVG